MPDNNSSHGFSDQELVAAFIEKRLSDNLAALKKYLPDLYQRFNHYQEKNLFLIYDSKGNINLFDKSKGVTLYDANPVQQCFDNLSNYIKSPIQRPFFIASTSNSYEGNKKDIENFSYVHSKALHRIGYAQLEILSQVASDTLKKVLPEVKWSSVEKEFEFSESIYHLPKFVNTMFVFSTGLGFDLDKLYLDRDVKIFCLIEPDEDVFYASLQLVDWASIIEKSIDKGFRIDLVVNSDRKELLRQTNLAVASFGRHNVAGAYLYSSFHKKEYSDIYHDIRDAISYSHLAGFGFYDDSRISMAHTYANAMNDIPLMASDKRVEKKLGQDKMPVMIIGNGPSLDNDLDYIRDNQDSFLIVSCGSALRTLLSNDIQPDFHAELERNACIYTWIKRSADGIDDFYEKLKKITLLSVSHIHPDVAQLFGRAGLVLKDIETGSSFIYHVLKKEGVAVLPRLAPSCVHTGVTITTILGFREFYFFGTDMGSSDPGRHHSKESGYKFVSENVAKKFDFKKNGVVFSSNFGEKDIYSSGFYPLFKYEIENVIKGWSDSFNGNIYFYNCSDGAYLDGASPKKTSDIKKLKRYSVDQKKDIVDTVFDAYFRCYPKAFSKELQASLEDVVKAVECASDYAASIVKPVKSVEEALCLGDRFVSEFHSKDVLEDRFAWLYSVFDGSLLYMLSTINSTAMMPGDEMNKLEAVNAQFEFLKDFFLHLKSDFRENCLTLDKEEYYSLFGDE